MPSSTPSRRGARRVLVLVLGLWLVSACVLVALAALDLIGGQREAEALRSTTPERLTDPSVAAKVHTAARRFDRADVLLGGPLLAPIRVVPLLGRQVRSAHAMAGAAADVAHAAADGLDEGHRLVVLPRGTGRERLVLIRRAAALAHTTERRLAGLDLGPGAWLVPPLASRREDLRTQIADIGQGLRRARLGADALADLLTGPRHYVVFAANNAEMRAGAGIFLSVGELTTTDGHFQLDRMRTVIDVPLVPGSVPLGGDIAARWGWLHPNDDLRNLMLSPRFDASAALAAQMWQAAGQGTADGVLALDPVALQEILAATGPVGVEGVTYTKDNVVYELLRGQYLRHPDLAERPERREELGAIAAATIGAIDAGHWSPEKLAAGLARAGRGRHLLVWSSRPDERAGWQAAGAGGELRRESLGVSIINRGGNKLDQFLTVDAELRLQAGNAGNTDGTLRIRLANKPPDDPAYIVGPHFGLPLEAGEYLGIVAVTLPGGARGGRLVGFDQLNVAGADGPTRVIGAEIRLKKGETRTILARFSLPTAAGVVRVEPSARVPAIRWRFGPQTWDDTAARTIRWPSSSS